MTKQDVADVGSFSVVGREPAAPNGVRAVRRRRGLPSGRAVTGGLLVALAAVGTFGAWSASTAGPRHAYVVARHDIPAGHRITAADLERRPLELPDGFPAFGDPATVLGASTIGPIGEGELVQPGAVSRRPSGEAAGSHLSFAVERSRALDGDLAAGDRIDIMATYGDTRPFTVAVLRHVLVVRVAGDTGTLGQRSDLVLTVAVGDPADVLALTHALRVAEITIVRSNRPPPAGAPEIFAPGTDSGGPGAPTAGPGGSGP